MELDHDCNQTGTNATVISAGLARVSKHFRVTNLPTLILVYGGSILDVRDGAIEDEALDSFLRSVIKATRM